MATIITKHEDGDATDAPLSLAYGELAVNTQAGKLWVGNSATTPINILGAIIPTGSVDGATLRWEAATTKWEQSSALKIADAGNVVATGSVTAASFSGTLQWSDVATTPTTLGGYGITDAATFAQGALADTATQPGDNVSTLTNDSGYLTSYTETDTLDSVTDRGATTTNAVTVGSLISTGTTTTDGLALSGRVTEEVFAVTGTTPALDPQNGTIQTWTLSGNSTPTFDAGFTAGASITLMIDDGAAYSITWPTTQWAGGSAPSLATTGYTVVELWRVGATYYGALVGEMS